MSYEIRVIEGQVIEGRVIEGQVIEGLLQENNLGAVHMFIWRRAGSVDRAGSLSRDDFCLVFI